MEGVGAHALEVKNNGESSVVNKDGYLFYTVDNINYLVGYTSGETTLVLPNDYNGESYVINESAFKSEYSWTLISVTITNSVTSIGSEAFSGCSSLTSVVIPDSVTSIGSDAFAYCSSLTSITIPNSVTTIGDHAFYGCSSLISIQIPNSVTRIDDEAFSNCSSIISVVLPNSVRSLSYTNGHFMFSGCSSITSVYFAGSFLDFWYKNITGLDPETIYYYSETQPTDTDYKYWHYVNGVITKW